MAVRIKPESSGSHLAATIGKDVPEGLDFDTRNPALDTTITIRGKRYRFPKILKDPTGYQREWLNDSTVRLLRATAMALIDDALPERFAKHIRQDLDDADFRRTPGDSIMAARIKKSARSRERANYVDVEGIRCFCMGVVPEFALDNLKLAQNSDWMANCNAEVLSLSDCRPVQHPKSSLFQGRQPKKPIEEVLRLVDREDWVWFGRPGVDYRMEDKPMVVRQPSMAVPATASEIAPIPMGNGNGEVPVVLAEAGRATLSERAIRSIDAVKSMLAGKLRAIRGHLRHERLSRHIRDYSSAEPPIIFAFASLFAVILFAIEPSAFNKSFPSATAFFAWVSGSIYSTMTISSRTLGASVVSAAIKLLCLGLSSLTNAIVWLQGTSVGQQLPVEKRIFFHQIHNLTRALQEC